MTLPTSIALWASVTALLFSIGACVVTFLSWRQSQLTSVAKLRTQLLDLADSVEDQDKRIRNLISRYTMQNLRFRREEARHETTAATDPEAAAVETRRNLADQLARGAIKVNQ